MIIRLNFSSAVDGHGAGALALGVLAADQVPLDEELAIDPCQLVDVEVEQLAGLAMAEDALAQRSSRSASRSCAVARLMKGKSARLRARRMRLLMTMSDSGPAPRSHSPRFRVRSSSSTVHPVPSSLLLHGLFAALRPRSVGSRRAVREARS